MDSLPIPKLRSSWLAALILAAALFLAYYVFAFGPLMRVYESHFVTVPFQRSRSQLQIWAHVPRYSFASGTSSLFVFVKNDGDQSLSDVEVYLLTASPANQPALLLPNTYNQQVYVSGIAYPIIEPHAIATGRISFLAQSQTQITGILVRIEGRPEELLYPRQTVFVEQSSAKALQHGLLEVILLPPWSNGYILALALLAAFLVRVESRMEDDPAGPEWRQQLKQDLARSWWVLLTMVGITAIVFLFLGVVDELTLPPLLALVALALIWLEGRRPAGVFSEWFAVLGFILAVSGSLFVAFKLLLIVLEFLFASMGFSRSMVSDPWMWRVTLLVDLGAWILIGRSRRYAKRFLRQIVFWGYSFFGLGLLALAMLAIDRERAPLAYGLWIAAILGGIIIAILHQRAALMGTKDAESDLSAVPSRRSPNNKKARAGRQPAK